MDKCPFCGAEVDEGYTYLVTYKCGTFHQYEKIWRSRPECYETEITRLKGETEEWQQKCQSLAAHSVLDENERELLSEEITRLKALVREMGEIIEWTRRDNKLGLRAAIREILTRPEVRAIMEGSDE